jgi:DNA-binding MarR family transcriptional regulator
LGQLVSDEQILKVINENHDKNLTVRNLMNLLGYYSTSTVHNKLKRLEKKGLISVERRTVIEVSQCRE